jgi:hypothetical protein
MIAAFIPSVCGRNIFHEPLRPAWRISTSGLVFLEVVSKPPLEPNLGVGARRLILKILYGWFF